MTDACLPCARRRMPVRLVEGMPGADDIWRVFETTGWNVEYRLTPGELLSAFESSRLVVGAYDGDRLVGMGRVVSDSVLHAMIYDLIVVPECRGAGVGGLILDRLVGRCVEAGIRDIQLFCAAGRRSFYERRGFAARPEDAPGMQLVRRDAPPEGSCPS